MFQTFLSTQYPFLHVTKMNTWVLRPKGIGEQHDRNIRLHKLNYFLFDRPLHEVQILTGHRGFKNIYEK